MGQTSAHIEVTAAMIEAGMAEFMRWESDEELEDPYVESLIERIFRAMKAAESRYSSYKPI